MRATAAPGPHAALFAEARRRLPAKAPGWRVTASSAPRGLGLVVSSPRGAALREAYFYASTPRLLDYAKPQPLTREGAAYRLDLARDPNGAPSERLAGVLVAGVGGSSVALEVDVAIPLGRNPPKQEKNP
jgi:hypothetical protein